MSSLSSIPDTRGFRFGVVLLLDWLPTKAAEPSLPKDVWLFRRSHFTFTTWWDFGEVQKLEANVRRPKPLGHRFKVLELEGLVTLDK